ncbi:MAG TPA: hypothetical protein PKE55_04655, partial [Kiritimatiellia bacterium]|nr:hypothetical protein [Kiritimatiellia bacterium]
MRSGGGVEGGGTSSPPGSGRCVVAMGGGRVELLHRPHEVAGIGRGYGITGDVRWLGAEGGGTSSPAG